MPSATDAVKAKGGDSKALLHGSDLFNARPKLDSITVTIDVVRDPGKQFNSPLVADFDGEVLDGIGCVGLNKTNCKRIAGVLGDDYDKWANAKITFTRVAVNNPSTGKLAHGLLVTKVNKTAIEVE